MSASAALAAFPDGMIVTDSAGVVQFANAAARAILRCEPADAVGQPASALLSLQSIEGRPIAWEASVLGAALNGAQAELVRGVLAGPNGGRVPVQVTAVPVAGEAGRPDGAVVMIRHGRGVDLQETSEALSQARKMETIGLLTGSVAHDFNNLLTVIRSGVDLLQRDGLSESQRARYVTAIGEAADRGAALTGQLLSFARREPVQTRTFDAHAALQRLSHILEAVAGPGVRVTLEVDRTPCWIVAPVSSFEIAIINLTVNARDAIDGDGEIRISLRNVARTAGLDGARKPGSFIAITVADSGTGIAKDALERIFEPFYTTKPVGRGTGLGLSQVHDFVQQSGGAVRVESRPGEGSRFTLFLPRGEASETPAGHERETRQRNGAVLRVLMVEDDERVAELSAQLLVSLGCSPTISSNPESALEILTRRRSDFDVLLTDVVMPGPVDGLQLANTVKSRWPDLPVVLTTGATDVLAQTEDDYTVLPKPFSAELLSTTLLRASGS